MNDIPLGTELIKIMVPTCSTKAKVIDHDSLSHSTAQLLLTPTPLNLIYKIQEIQKLFGIPHQPMVYIHTESLSACATSQVWLGMGDKGVVEREPHFFS